MSSISALHIASGHAKTFGDRRGTRFLFESCVKISMRRGRYDRHERFKRDVGPGLINGAKVGSHEGEYDDLYGEGCRVENERRHKLSGGLALGRRNVGPMRNALGTQGGEGYGRTFGCPLWVEGERRKCGPALRRGYKRSRPRRQLPAPRSSAAIADPTEQNVTGPFNRAVTCARMCRDVELRRHGGQLGEPWSEGWDTPQYGDVVRSISCRTASGFIPFLESDLQPPFGFPEREARDCQPLRPKDIV